MNRTAKLANPTLALAAQIGWPKAFGVFTGNGCARILHATFMTEPEAWRYILRKGVRAVAWVERI